jgi:hypothetical protein
MSCLKLHWPSALSLYSPPETQTETQTEAQTDAPSAGTALLDEPVIISFSGRQARIDSQAALLSRARLIHHNRCCPECGRAAVIPVDAEPLRIYRDGSSAPVISDPLAFACECCSHEWHG